MIPIFKIRCSAIGKIMGGAFNSPTPIQIARIEELQSKEKRTDKQSEELAALIAKRDSKPDLQQGAKTYCETWLKEQLYARTTQFSSKYTEKGIECEQSAIDMVAEQMGYGFVMKNTVRKENEYMTGECDLLLPHIVEEIKNSWSCFTFPLFATVVPDTDYMFQAQGYMHLFDRTKAAVNYCLIDAPDELIIREACNVSRKAGYEEVDGELYDEVKAKMIYSHLPIELRHKRFEFERDDTIIAAIEQQVILCRAYIETLMPQFAELTLTA